MKTHHPKQLKNPPRPLFSCGIFRYCTTETVLSPTYPNPHTSTLPPLSDPPPPPPPPPSPPPRLLTNYPLPPTPQPESESSSSSTSQSFTQWRFPVPNSPILNQHPPSEFTLHPTPESSQNPNPTPPPPPPPPLLIPYTNLAELFHVAELQFSTGSDASRHSTLQLLERSLVPNPPAEGGGDPTCPPAVMSEVVSLLKDKEGAKPATKVLLALCLSEGNRHVAVEAGAVVEVVEVLTGLEGATAERALAALELLCTVAEGAAEIRAHALAVPMLVEMMGRMTGRGKECAVSILAAIFGGGGGGGGGGGEAVEPADHVARAVVLALQGECSARGRRKGTQLLKVLQENGRLDLTEPLDLLIMQD
ncbi:hypothetical protein BVC80_157g101 [Macleaya cordata]|uniref:U-box domain-containing protein n=1 Tax=Macleaya cordata TaxID=56857 RepID=A0A200RC55_MACCD|nr:hypothetical protein BVC80_157g101 [Macleaya cordata]